MKAVYLKEMRNYFTTPLGYIFLGFILVIFGIYYLMYGLIYQMADYSNVLNSVTLLVLFAMPLLTMRIFSEEAKNKTDQLLLTSPIQVWKIVLGKYLAALTLFTIALAITVIQPLILAGMGGAVPSQKVIGGYIGFFLYGCAFISIGTLISAMTDNQLIAAIASIGIFIVIFMLNGIANLLPVTHIFVLCVIILAILVLCFLIYRAIKDVYVTGLVGLVLIIAAVLIYFFLPSAYDNLLVKVADWTSLVTRYSDFYTGVFDFSNVIFYLTFTALMIFITIQVVEKRRWN